MKPKGRIRRREQCPGSDAPVMQMPIYEWQNMLKCPQCGVNVLIRRSDNTFTKHTRPIPERAKTTAQGGA